MKTLYVDNDCKEGSEFKAFNTVVYMSPTLIQ